MGSVREGISIARELFSMLKEAQPFIEAMRPPPQPMTDDPRLVPVQRPVGAIMPPAGRVEVVPARAESVVPPASEADAAEREERAVVRELVLVKLPREEIVEALLTFAPFAVEAWPDSVRVAFEKHAATVKAVVADVDGADLRAGVPAAFEKHQAGLRALLLDVDEARLRALASRVIDSRPIGEVRLARSMIEGALASAKKTESDTAGGATA